MDVNPEILAFLQDNPKAVEGMYALANRIGQSFELARVPLGHGLPDGLFARYILTQSVIGVLLVDGTFVEV